MGGRKVLGVTAVAAALVVLPTVSHAQSAFTGVVRENAGAVLPGVTRRSREPDAHRARHIGRDRQLRRVPHVDLRPGTYTLTFTRPGFKASSR